MSPKLLQNVINRSILICSLTLAAQEKGMWRAESSTARSITGDVALSDERISINFSTFPMIRIRSLEKAETSAAFDAVSTADGTGSLYSLNIPGTKKFLHKNTLCGTEDAQWMATYVSGKTLQLAFFSGGKTPVLTLDAMANSTNLCGTFSYAK
jgi:hypothetical protein